MSSRAERLAARNAKKSSTSHDSEDLSPKAVKRRKIMMRDTISETMKTRCYFNKIVQYLYTFDYVQTLCRVCTDYHHFRLSSHNTVSSLLRQMLIREFGAELYEKQTKRQSHNVYGSIRWLYGLFRDSYDLQRDSFYNRMAHGEDLGWGFGSNDLNFCRTFFLMRSPPKLLFPITYGFKHHYARKRIKSISRMVWKFQYENENVFEWMLKLLFADDAAIDVVDGFYNFIIQNYSSNKDKWFTEGNGQNWFWIFRDMMTLNLIKCKPSHALWWFNKVCYIYITDGTRTASATAQCLSVIVNGMHDKTCIECHTEKDKSDYDKSVWQPHEWKRLWLIRDFRDKIKHIGDLVDVKNNADAMKEWYFLRKPCNECRDHLRQIFDIEYFETFEEKRLEAMGIPKELREFKWLYRDCNALTKETRDKIVSFMMGKYGRNDVEVENVILNEIQENQMVTKQYVFRMFFKTKKWKKLCVMKRKKECCGNSD
eukprot:142568_1